MTTRSPSLCSRPLAPEIPEALVTASVTIPLGCVVTA
jgi:hypothetical protein